MSIPSSAGGTPHPSRGGIYSRTPPRGNGPRARIARIEPSRPSSRPRGPGSRMPRRQPDTELDHDRGGMVRSRPSRPSIEARPPRSPAASDAGSVRTTDPPEPDRPAGTTAPWSPVDQPTRRARVGIRRAAGGARARCRSRRREPCRAHARRLEVPPIEAPRHPLPDRRRYFLSSFEPSGDYDAVIVAVTDGGRRRYFTTRDGARLAEVDEVSFERRRESGTRSILELDERELGELEVELQFVRPVRGRDPIAEAEADAAHEVRGATSAPTCRRMPLLRSRAAARRRTSRRTGQTSHSHTGRPSLRSRPRVSCSRRTRSTTRWTTR